MAAASQLSPRWCWGDATHYLMSSSGGEVAAVEVEAKDVERRRGELA